MKKKKQLIIFLIFIFIIVFCICIFLLSHLSQRKESMYNNNNTIPISGDSDINEDVLEKTNYVPYNGNIINNDIIGNTNNKSSTIPKNIKAEAEDIDSWEEEKPITQENLKLKRTSKPYSYLLMKQCIAKFYSSKENAYSILPEELKKYDISNFYSNINRSDFCIDEIFQASVSLSKDFYFVYYRVQNTDTTMEKKSLIVKVDKKNLSFAIYPYEYLKTKNYIELKANDIISLEIINANDINNIETNRYNVNSIIKDNLTYVKELLDRLKFDLNYDLEHLYNSIDSEYKNIRFFNNYDNFAKFINEKKYEYLNDIFKGYQVFNIDKGIQYIGVCESNNRYVFNVTDLTDYTIQFDNYTTVLPIYSKIYQSNFPKVRAKYCIDRVRKAINDKNYEFVYSKLNPVQKSNSYPDYNEFIKFIQIYFYDKNIFEYEDVVQISDYVYRYSVNIKDENNSDSLERTMNMTITLKDDEDFTISITL